jgi:hypothetical protein
MNQANHHLDYQAFVAFRASQRRNSFWPGQSGGKMEQELTTDRPGRVDPSSGRHFAPQARQLIH